jgi:hypothetical protein
MLGLGSGGTWDTTLHTVRGEGSGSRDVDSFRANVSIRRGSGAPSTDVPGSTAKIGGTQLCDQLHCRSNGSINYTVLTVVRLFVILNQDRVEDH